MIVFAIPLIVLFVSTWEALSRTNSPEASIIVTILSSEGSKTVIVVSKSSTLDPSKINGLEFVKMLLAFLRTTFELNLASLKVPEVIMQIILILE